MTKPTTEELVAALHVANDREVSDADAVMLAACLVESRGMVVDAASVGGALLMFAARPIAWERVEEILHELAAKGFVEDVG